MPLYFAYGSNMDREAMRLRCPNSRALGRARLARHRFFIMSSGHGSVKRDQRMDVHGVLYDLAFGDIATLDRHQETGRGLYQKISQSVLRDGAAPVRALLYVGASAQEAARGSDLDGMIAAARAWEFPDPYIAYLLSLAGGAAANAGVTSGGRRAIRLKGV
ncbi:MAG TPA: gamma-glutamylcyclotransferase family protein [Methylovirgula sp.]